MLLLQPPPVFLSAVMRRWRRGIDSRNAVAIYGGGGFLFAALHAAECHMSPQRRQQVDNTLMLALGKVMELARRSD